MHEQNVNPQSGPVMAFLQARMGSRRLPGKTMMQIRGKTILERAIERLRAAPVVEGTAVLTTELDQDQVIVKEALRLGAPVYRGPENDVLRRFQGAAAEFRPGIIIRATADNPLIDIGSICRIVHQLNAGGLDFCMETGLPYGTATEAFTAAALAKADGLATDARDREHVTLYIKEHTEEFKVGFLKAPKSLCHPGLRFTVDTPDDLAFIERLIRCIPEQDRPIHLEKYIPFVSTILSGVECLKELECKALSMS